MAAVSELLSEARSHEAMLKELWQRLDAGVQSGRHPLHTCALATQAISTDAAPSVRTVVLRKADALERVLRCHTDARSPKVQQIERHPAVSMLFYDVVGKLQLRASGLATLHRQNDIANTAWRASSASSQACYKTTFAPSATIDVPFNNADHLTLNDAEAFKNFVVIDVKVKEFDVLELSYAGHQRAVFHYERDAWQFSWRAV